MARVLIIGYGNPLRSDDGLGWQIANELSRSNRCAEIEVLPCPQLTPELAQAVSAAELVLFIDCVRDGQPGNFHCDELAPQPGSPSLTHHLTPGALLGLSSELYGACPPILRPNRLRAELRARRRSVSGGRSDAGSSEIESTRLVRGVPGRVSLPALIDPIDHENAGLDFLVFSTPQEWPEN